MQPQEKHQLATFGADARRRVALEVKCNVSAVCLKSACQALAAVVAFSQCYLLDYPLVQVDDCIAKFLYMKSMTGKVKQLKAEGKSMPKDFQQLEQEFGEGTSAFVCIVHT